MRNNHNVVRGQLWLRRPRFSSVWRAVLYLVGAFVGAQALVVIGLSVVARRRRFRSPEAGFPYLRLGEVRLGENQLQLFSYGQDLYEAMLAAIDGARECIYLESFIWKDDGVGRTFKEHLAAKAAEGVNVYVIFDIFGNLVVPRAFKRFPSSIRVLQFWGLRRPWHLLDPRRYAVDHRKLLVVDSHIGFIGGYNLGSLYATEWRDTHLCVRGPAAMDLAQSFVDFWNRFCRKSNRITTYYPRSFDPTIALHTNDSMRLTFPIRDMYIGAIDRAQRQILLTNAYFIPDHILLEALEAAAQRGVDVQVLLPQSSNHILADWAARGYFTRCLAAGIRIFGYQQAMIHAKTCTIDGQWSTIGTANLDRLSSVGNYEINIEIYSEELAHEMEALFTCDKTNAIEVAAERWGIRPWYVKMSERLLSPLRVGL
ncbi:MAG: phosphatidylserine/phosphatidylglycerophosphate/cardiolipin synthase family protein [Ktedonobacterales bacterium]|nr:phosphatidylserine/phosphatidylglycerophosphate/cardiolipin synthase family protein [Ktedonobacterales bacterium]